MPPKRRLLDDDDVEPLYEDRLEKRFALNVRAGSAAKRKREQGEGGAGAGAGAGAGVERLDFSGLKLRPDHRVRPLYVCPDRRIFLETWSPWYKQAYDFLIAIAAPVSRPNLVHEYQLKMSSLHAAVSIGLETTDIIQGLRQLSKVELDPTVVNYIKACTSTYGKVKLVLKRNKFFVESGDPEVLQNLLKDDIVRNARETAPATVAAAAATEDGAGMATGDKEAAAGARKQHEDAQKLVPMLDEGDDETPLQDGRAAQGEVELHSFEINPVHVSAVKRRCLELDLPLLEEYDFRNDSVNPDLAIDLKPTTALRPYQEKSLSKMFGNGRARSGIIVLPCGAGKTLVGVTSACTVKKNTLVLCNSTVAVEQWRNQFLLWADISERCIARFTSAAKEKPETDAGIVITTYSMIGYGQRRSEAAESVMQSLREKEWGLMLLDEVHVVPAETFRRVLNVTHAHCKLGLTATLVREDSKIVDLDFLIGPKLYEANWLDLVAAGHIANVQCTEIWCPMTGEFYREYLSGSVERKTLLAVMNPNKFQACQVLIQRHLARGDKIIVFSDSLFALKYYAIELKCPFIYGETPHNERTEYLELFENGRYPCIFISKVGDVALDLPGASVIIQISSHGGSRRQEAQRLGRILRPKSRSAKEEFNAFFYTLVSRDTQEMFFSTKRQQFLVDQGYAFNIQEDIWSTMTEQEKGVLRLADTKDQLELLTKALNVEEKAADNEDAYDVVRNSVVAPAPTVKRATGSAAALAGGGDMSYMEVKKNEPSASAKSSTKQRINNIVNPLFRNADRHGKDDFFLF